MDEKPAGKPDCNARTEGRESGIERGWLEAGTEGKTPIIFGRNSDGVHTTPDLGAWHGW